MGSTVSRIQYDTSDSSARQSERETSADGQGSPAGPEESGAERSAEKLVRVIGPRQPGMIQRFREFWAARRLTFYFGRRLLEKLYQRTWLGWLWIPLRPVLAVGSRVLVFGGLLGAPSQGAPYLLFFLVGMASWQLFAYTLFWGTRTIEQAQGVLRRLYVPRLTCLLGALVPSGVNFLLYVAMVLIAVGYYTLVDGAFPLTFGPNTPLIAVGLLAGIALALAIACWTSILGAQARDVRFSIAYILSFWFFLTPVIYPLSEVPAGLETIASLNPMTAPIEMIRLGLFGAGELPLTATLSTVIVTLVVGVPGLWFFNRSEAAALDAL